MKTRNLMGAYLKIRHAGAYYTATVIDLQSGTDRPKRVRIQHDRQLAGKVLMPSEYQVMEILK